MTATEPMLATHGSHTAIRWKPWLLLWSITAVFQIFLLINNASLDTFLWRTTRWFTGDQDAYKWAQVKAAHATEPDAPFYFKNDPPLIRTNALGQIEGKFYKRSEIFWRVMRDLGEPVTTALVIAIVWIYDRRRHKAALIVLAATALTGLTGWLIRAIGGRYRPINIEGDNVWHLFRGFSETRDLSWPSGHATLAFATAAALTYLSPKGKYLFLFLATFCAITRVVMQAHFYSDIIFGGAVGWTFGWFITRLFDKLIFDPQALPATGNSPAKTQEISV